MSSSEVEELENLKKRKEKLERERMKADTELSHLKGEQADLLKTVEEKFGVKNLDDLRALSEQKKGEAREKLQSFGSLLTGIETKLSEVKASD